jgi:hypothetical protein
VPESNRAKTLLALLQEEVRAVLKAPVAPGPDEGFFDLGMDSLMAVELGNRLQALLGGSGRVAPTVAFDHPTARRLANHLLGDILAPRAKAPRPAPAAAREDDRLRTFEESLEAMDDDGLIAALEDLTRDVLEEGS